MLVLWGTCRMAKILTSASLFALLSTSKERRTFKQVFQSLYSTLWLFKCGESIAIPYTDIIEGGGIVYDSQEDAEYHETLHKMGALGR